MSDDDDYDNELELKMNFEMSNYVILYDTPLCYFNSCFSNRLSVLEPKPNLRD